MNTNIKIPLTDQERNLISNIYHNKPSAKLATRKEVTDLVELFISQLLNGVTEDQPESRQYVRSAPIAKQIIREGYKYFVNDIQVTAEVFHDPAIAQKNAEMGDIAAASRR